MLKLLQHMFKTLVAGFKTLSESSRGTYNKRTDEVSNLRNEMLSGSSSPVTDKKNLITDRKNIGDDMRRSMSKMAMNNG